MVISLAFGLVAGVISSFLAAGVIVDKRFRDVACSASFFMLVQVRARVTLEHVLRLGLGLELDRAALLDVSAVDDRQVSISEVRY